MDRHSSSAKIKSSTLQAACPQTPANPSIQTADPAAAASCQATKAKSKAVIKLHSRDEVKSLSFEATGLDTASADRVTPKDKKRRRKSANHSTIPSETAPAHSTQISRFTELLSIFGREDHDEDVTAELFELSSVICKTDFTADLDDDLFVGTHARLASSFSSFLALDEAEFNQNAGVTTKIPHHICIGLSLLRCARHTGPRTMKARFTTVSSDLMKDMLDSLFKFLRNAQAKPEGRRCKSGDRRGPDLPTLCQCVQAVKDSVKRMADSDEHLLSVTKLAIHGISSGSVSVQLIQQSIGLLLAVASRSADQLKSVLEEVLLAIDDEHVADKASRVVPVVGTETKLRPFSVLLLRLFQSIPPSDEASNFELSVKSTACYFFRLFGRRFFRDEQKSERSLQSPKDEGKAWLDSLMEDIFSVLFLPQYPVAEVLLSTFVDTFLGMLRPDASDKLSDRPRAIAIDVVSVTLSRLAVRRNALTGASTTAKTCNGSQMHGSMVFDEQQIATRDSGLKNLVLSELGLHHGEIFREASTFLRHLWSSGEESTETNVDQAAERSSSPIETLQRLSASLALQSSVLNRLPSRVNSFLLQLVRESKPNDRSRILRAANEIFAADVSIVHPSFLNVVRQQYLFDASNASVRSGAVELLGKLFLSDMKTPTGDHDGCFNTIASRSLDTSVKVRLAVLSFLRDVCDLERMCEDTSSIDGQTLVGMSVTNCTLKGWVNGQLVAFDSKTSLFKVEFSDGDIERVPKDSVLAGLVLGARSDDVTSAPSFAVNPRFVSAVSKAAGMLLYSLRGQEEDSVVERCLSLFTSLWFRDDSPVPYNLRLQEIEIAVQSTESCQWLESVIRHAVTVKQGNVEELSSWYVRQLFAKIAAIHNTGKHSPSQRPAVFNDFQTRASLLVSVLKTMVPFARASPQHFCERMHEFAPILLELELCKEQHQVVRSLLDIVEAVVESGTQTSPEVDERILRAFLSGAFKLNDPKRFGKTDDIARAVKCFCTVVKLNRGHAAERALLGTLLQCVQFLKGYIDHPAEENVPWVPRSLILAGAVVRHCDLSSLSHHGGEVAADSKEKLFLMTLTHFSNHLLEPVKKASLYVVGAVLVHEPEKALQKSCMKLLVRSLSTGSSPSLQCQVLRNLHDQFQIEDDRMALQASVDRTCPDEDAGVPPNTSTSIMHKFHDLILISSLSNNANVRFDAVSLILLVLRRGMTATYLAIPYLIAQQALCDGSSQLALRALDSIREKETTHYQPRAFWDGIVMSTAFCQSEADLTRNSFATAFRHLASIGRDGNRAVRQLLQCASSKFDKFSNASGTIEDQCSFEFKLYVASIVARLPFPTVDGPLFFIHHIHKLVTVLAGGCLEGLGAAVAQGQAVAAAAESVNRWRQEGACIGLLLGVQEHLQSEYAIKTDRIKKFFSSPETVDKTTRTRSEDGAVFVPIRLFQDQDMAVMREDLSRLRALLHSDLFADSVVLSDAPSPCKQASDHTNGAIVKAGCETDPAPTEPAQKKAQKKGKHAKRKKRVQESPSPTSSPSEDMEESSSAPPKQEGGQQQGRRQRQQSARKRALKEGGGRKRAVAEEPPDVEPAGKKRRKSCR